VVELVVELVVEACVAVDDVVAVAVVDVEDEVVGEAGVVELVVEGVEVDVVAGEGVVVGAPSSTVWKTSKDAVYVGREMLNWLFVAMTEETCAKPAELSTYLSAVLAERVTPASAKFAVYAFSGSLLNITTNSFCRAEFLAAYTGVSRLSD